MIATEERVTTVYESQKEQNRQRDLFLCIPSRIILNERGSSFFIAHGKTLHCFETADRERQFGFHLEKTEFSWLKKLILNNYLKKMEIQIRDISVCRAYLEDAIKLIFFSMFRHRINASILSSVYNSPLVRTWNRINPKKSIGSGIKVPEGSFEKLLNSKAPGKLGELKTMLRDKIAEGIPPSFAESREDSRDLHNFIDELVFRINPLVFFVLAGSDEEDSRRLIQNISREVIEYIRRFDIVNLAALLTIELVAAAERSALVRILEYTGNITELLKDPNKRKTIMEKKGFRGSTVVVSLPGEMPRENRRFRFRISIHNNGADAKEERRLMENFTEQSFSFKDGKDLKEFFKTSPSRRENSVYEDGGLCFYHLNALQDQCKKNNILLDTAIKNSYSGKSVVTTLWFGF
ncbi:MAG: hypothetical protein LBE02_00525 [Spirochaetaceae bacterium]|jgi:hypothetical protein|nr:hypothetical protein [Spirochaetaceae bacterium]